MSKDSHVLVVRKQVEVVGETVAGNGHGDGQAGNERKPRNPAGTDQGGRQSSLEGRRVEEAGCMHI